MKSKIQKLLILTIATAYAVPANCAEKYALLIGVTTYEHARMNDTRLEYPEDDAQAVAALLRKSGYTVELLLGDEATNSAIEQSIDKVGLKGTQDGVVVIGLFGHGVQYDEDAYFCGYDTGVRYVKDSEGQKLRDRNGQPRLEPDPESMTSMRRILDSLAVCGAGGKLLIADCCREDPSAARGRAFGSKLKVSDIPQGTVALFACSANEQALEHSDWKHGAFTRALLDESDAGNADSAAVLFASVQRKVSQLVKEKTRGDQEQNVHGILNGNVQLGLIGKPVIVAKPAPVMIPRPSALRAPFSPTTASRSQQNWAAYLKRPMTVTNSIGMSLRLVPPGHFSMGSSENSRGPNEKPHQVQISRPLYVSQHETTVSEFAAFVRDSGYRTTTESNDNGSNRGWVQSLGRFTQKHGFSWQNPGWAQEGNHPVVNVSWVDVDAFVKWLSNKEGKRYRLLTEAEWEYCCRAGTTTAYSVGQSPSQLVNVGNVLDSVGMQTFGRDSQFNQQRASDSISGRDGYVFTAPVGRYQANAFGLFDFHGNVCEWCSDWYADDYGFSSDQDPKGALSGEDHSARGGRFDTGKYLAKSSTRNHGPPLMSDMILGFRVAMEAE